MPKIVAAETQGQHENFEIRDLKSSNRLKLVRQDRISVDPDSCWIEREGRRYPVMNYNAFGVAIFAAEAMEPGTELKGFAFVCYDIEVAELGLRVVRCDKTEAGYCVGLSVEQEPLSVERVTAVLLARQVIADQSAEAARGSDVPLEFKAIVYEIKDWLERLQERVNTLAEKIKAGSRTESEIFEDTISQVMSAYFASQFYPVYDRLAATLNSTPQEKVKLAVDFFRTQLHALVYQAPFAERSYRKPLGYAGDYEMMNLIYRTEPSGLTLFAKCLNRYFVQEPAARAVRNRSDYLLSKIKQTHAAHRSENRKIKFLSVASGPAFEVERFVKEAKSLDAKEVEFHCLDQDLHSLKHAQRRIEETQRREGTNFKIKPVNRAIKNVIVSGIEESGYDLVYSAGLFDYFSDPVAQMAAQKMYESVAPGGRMIIGNFNVYNPTRFLMELALDWNLIYRSEDDLRRLFGHLGGDLAVEQEELGINLFCVVTKPK